MDTLAGIVVIVGVVASAVAWRLVARGRDVWRTMPPMYVTLGLVAVLRASSLAAPFPVVGRSFTVGFQLGFGLLTGAVLFVATRVFVALPGRSAAFVPHTPDAHSRAD